MRCSELSLLGGETERELFLYYTYNIRNTKETEAGLGHAAMISDPTFVVADFFGFYVFPSTGEKRVEP